MTLYNVNEVVCEIVGMLEKKRIPVGAVDEILAKVKEEVMNFTPVVRNGVVGLSKEDYDKQGETPGEAWGFGNPCRR